MTKLRRFSLFLSLLVVATAIFSSRATIAEAHILKTDGTIGAVLHIDPEDDPIAQQPANFFFEFKDKANKFSAANCDCTIAINENGKQIYQAPLFQSSTDPSLNAPSLTYTFPQRDVYQVIVTGKPTVVQAFQPFQLTYDIRVDRTAQSLSASQAATSVGFTKYLLPISLLGVIVVVFFVFIFSDRLKRAKPSDQEEQTDGAKKLMCLLAILLSAYFCFHLFPTDHITQNDTTISVTIDHLSVLPSVTMPLVEAPNLPVIPKSSQVTVLVDKAIDDSRAANPQNKSPPHPFIT